MPAKNHDLHGSAPDKSPVALLLIDVINDLDFPEANQLLPQALAMARQLKKLKDRARRGGIPSIYINDNFGRWQSNFPALVDHCLKKRCTGRPLVKLLLPHRDDYFVLKPKHSGFYSTTLETLLHYLGVNTVILTGLATNICVLFTANDAYMRDLKLIIPSDCVAANTTKDHLHALGLMQKILKADVRVSEEIKFSTKRRKK